MQNYPWWQLWGAFLPFSIFLQQMHKANTERGNTKCSDGGKKQILILNQTQYDSKQDEVAECCE